MKFVLKIFFIVVIGITLPSLWRLLIIDIELFFILFSILLLNLISLYGGVVYLKYYFFPPVIGIALFNILSFYLSILFVPFVDFQCGVFNPGTLYLVLLSNLVFYVVYFWTASSLKFKRSNNNFKMIQTKEKLVVLSFFSFILSWLPIPISDIGNLLQYFSLSILLVCYYRYKTGIFLKTILGLLILFLLIKALFSTLVFNLVYIYLFCFFIFVIEGFSQKNNRVEFFVFTLLIAIIGSSLSLIKMDLRTNTEVGNVGIKESVNSIFNKAVAANNSEELDSKNSIFWRLTYTASALSHIVQETPQKVPFWGGTSYLPALYKFIPRFLWPNKPTENMGQDFGHTYGLLAVDNLTTSMNAPILVEAYFNFGIIGIILISIVMGIVIGFGYADFNLRRGNSRDVLSVFVIALFSLYSVQWESNLSMYIGKLVVLYFIVTGYKLINKKKIVI